MRLLLLVFLGCAAAAEPVLRPGTRLLLAGDSLTEQLQYSRMVEIYLRACHPQLRIEVAQAGWGGEDMGGFQRRMAVAAGWFHPTAISMLYGMNDGCYLAPDEGRTAKYAKALALAVEGAERMGARPVVIAPGAVDTTSFDTGQFHRPGVDAVVYNRTLGAMRDRAKALAGERGLPFGDLNRDLLAVMAGAKRRLGERHLVLGGDGVHPGPNGHLAIAWTVLRALGADGDLGTIGMDWPAGAATATGGHRVVERTGGVLTIDSDRYAYAGPPEARSILPDLPFIRDLARLVLVVKGLPPGPATVRWDEAEIVVDAAELAAGISLMERFERTPFDAALRKLAASVERKQAYESGLIRGVLPGFEKARTMARDGADIEGHLAAVQAELVRKWQAISDALRDEVPTVRHRLVVVPRAEGRPVAP